MPCGLSLRSPTTNPACGHVRELRITLGMWYSSRINMMIRSDGVANAFENASVPFPTVTPMVQISLLDFSVGEFQKGL